MKNYVLKFGLYSSLLITGLFGASWLIWGTSLDYNLAEWMGYVSMVVSLSFIFFGIKAYRDEVGEGYIKFSVGLKIGSLISLLPSTAFFIYTALLFVFQSDKLLGYTENSMSPEQMAQFEANKELFLNPFFQGFIMFLTVFVIGFIITLISAWILQKVRKTDTSNT